MSYLSPIFQLNDQTLEGSFSAVSTPNFATKASFFSIFRDLQDLQSFAPLRSQNCNKNLSNFFQFCKMYQTVWLRFDKKLILQTSLSRTRRELSNAYLLAKLGFGTAENEPSKVRCTLAASRTLWGRTTAGWTRLLSPTRKAVGLNEKPPGCHRNLCKDTIE